MKKVKKYIITATLLLTLPLLIFAENPAIETNIFSFGPRAIYSTPKDADTGQWSAGAQGRLRLSPGLGLEGSVDYRRNNFSNLTIITTYPVQASVLVYLMPGTDLNPFLLGGGGWYYTQVNGPYSFNDTDFRFGLHIGAGFEFTLTEFIFLDASYRYVWLQSVTSKDINTLDKTLQDSGSMVTIGLNIYFK